MKIWGLRPHLMPANRTRETRCQWTLCDVDYACRDMFECQKSHNNTDDCIESSGTTAKMAQIKLMRYETLGRVRARSNGAVLTDFIDQALLKRRTSNTATREGNGMGIERDWGRRTGNGVLLDRSTAFARIETRA